MSDTDRIPLARPALGDAEINAVERALRSGRLVLGPENLRFEAALAERAGRAHGICVSSGTTALELALWALDIGPGDEVLIPSFGFAAAANAVVRLGATPVAVDVEPTGWTLDVEAAAATVGERTRCVVAIDQLGLVTEAAPISELTRARALHLIDDAACGFGGCDSSGVPGGGYGVLATLSFHPRKVITTGEGGAILTDDSELARVIRELRNQGQRGRGRFARPGTNARLAEASAAMGAAQMSRLDAMLAERRMLIEGYIERLSGLLESERLSIQAVPDGAAHAYQTFAVLLAEGVDRDAVVAALDDADIEAGPATYAFHRLEPFSAAARGPLPVADALHERSLALPLYIGMRSAELDRVGAALTEVLA
jgi:perosamine synthetase